MNLISEYAIVVGPNDNVAVVKKETFVDLEVSNTPIFERMKNDLDLSASGLEAKAETHKHREFQFWAEQTVSL